MYTKGHCGVSLLVYAPVGLGLFLSGNAPAAVTGGAVMLALAMVPDCDHGIPFIDHRGPTHTVAFAVVIGMLLGAGAVLFGTDSASGTQLRTASFLFAMGTLAVLSHLLADLLTPMGVAPFWPVSTRRYSLDITPAKDPTANNVLLGVGVAVTASGLYLLNAMA